MKKAPSGLPPWIDRAALAVAVVVVAAVFWFTYGPALGLPRSLIDDPVFAGNAEQFSTVVKQSGFVEALKQDVSAKLRLMNPGYSILTWMLHGALGTSPFPHHLLKLLQLALVVAGVFVIAGTWGFTRRVNPAAGAVAALCFLLAEVPYWHGLQSLRANWYRLYTTDTALVFFGLLHVTSMWVGLRVSRRKSWALLLCSFVLFWIALTMKITAVALSGPVLMLVLLLVVCRDERWKPLLILFGAMCIAFVCQFAAVRWLSSGYPATYGSNFHFSIDGLMSRQLFYRNSYKDAFGILYYIVPMSLVTRMISSLSVDRTQWRNVILQNSPNLMSLAYWISLTLIYLPWKHELPRYMVPGHVWFCILAGMEVAAWLMLRPVKWQVAGVVAFSALVASFVEPGWIWWAGLTAALIFATIKRSPSTMSGYVLGTYLAAFLYFIPTGVMNARVLHEDYVLREKNSWAAVEELVGRTSDGDVVGFGAHNMDEQYHGILYWARDIHGKDLHPRLVKSAKDAENTAVVVIMRAIMPKDLINEYMAFPVLNVVTNHASAQGSAGFWDFRERLWRGKSVLPAKAVFNHQWIFLKGGKTPATQVPMRKKE